MLGNFDYFDNFDEIPLEDLKRSIPLSGLNGDPDDVDEDYEDLFDDELDEESY